MSAEPVAEIADRVMGQMSPWVSFLRIKMAPTLNNEINKFKPAIRAMSLSDLHKSKEIYTLQKQDHQMMVASGMAALVSLQQLPNQVGPTKFMSERMARLLNSVMTNLMPEEILKATIHEIRERERANAYVNEEEEKKK